jgi:hypothetical protein
MTMLNQCDANKELICRSKKSKVMPGQGEWMMAGGGGTRKVGFFTRRDINNAKS